MSLDLDRREFLAGTTALAMGRGWQARPYTFEPTAAGRVLTSGDGRVAFEYLATKPAGSLLSAESACCFHPVNTPSGQRVSDLAPKDHTTHRGVFLAWHAMEFKMPEPVRADFWGWGRYAPTANRVITNRDLRLAAADTSSATIEIQNDWSIEGKRVVVERTTARWRGGADVNLLDLTSVLTPDVEMTIDRQAFGGFCARGRNDGPSAISNAQGVVELPNSNAGNPELNWPAAPWYAYTVEPVGGTPVGWAVIDHPANRTASWHEPRSVHFLQPAIMAQAPVIVAAGTSLALRYRLALFDGAVPTALLNTLAAEFRA
jgi:hypothetical protein